MLLSNSVLDYHLLKLKKSKFRNSFTLHTKDYQYLEKHGMPRSFVSIGLGCDIQHAKELTYSEGMDLNNKKLETPIGISCRICPRVDCQQRAFPPIDKDLKLDISYRGTSPYITA